MNARAYADNAHAYRSKGFSPVPLPPGEKSPPPKGWTGYAAPMASGADVQDWVDNGHADGNIALRLPQTVLRLDLDAYEGKSGLDTMLAAVDRLGPLPLTWTSTSRPGTRSGIRFYRVPEGRQWADIVGPGVEVIHHGHRYAVAAPSLHPEGRSYLWIDQGGEEGDPPSIDDLPELPAAWVADLDRGDVADRGEKAEVTSGEARAWLDALPPGEPCRYVNRLIDNAAEALAAEESRHDTIRTYVGKMIRAGDQGHLGTGAGLDTLESLFLSALKGGKPRGADRGEWSRMVDGSIGHAVANPTSVLAKGCCSVDLPTDAIVDDVTEESPDGHRRIALTPASAIKVRRVSWLWADRIAIGTLALLAGPEGLGKSTLGAWLTARITRGDLPGEFAGRPRSVLICAAEDSWEHTIVPRLIAAGADLDRVFRVEVKTADEITVGLSLPRDLIKLEQAAIDTDAALLVLDPLMSRISEGLDTHKDGDVRRALEPLVAIADRAHLSILGLIHHNKSGSSDPLQLVMASKAFTAVARSVHTAIGDPADDTGQRRLFGTPKNNLGRGDLPTLAFTIAGHAIDTDDGRCWTGRLDWGGEVDGTIADAMQRSNVDPEERSATAEAGAWLVDYLTSKGSTAKSADVKKHAIAAGHSERTLGRARLREKVTTESVGYPRISYWSLPGTQPKPDDDSPVVPPVAPPPLGRTSIGITGPNGEETRRSAPVVPVVPAVPTHGDGGINGTTASWSKCACGNPMYSGNPKCAKCILDAERVKTAS